jgi:hypothetical protein
MGTYGDDRYGGDRWRERNRDRDYGRGDYRGQSGPGSYGGRDDDRGFLDRAGDELRSWFGDEEAQRRREADERSWAREQGMTGRRDNDYGRDSGRGNAGGFGGGWGNQRGESWNRERPGERGWFGGDRDERFGDTGRGERYGGDDDRGRRFDRASRDAAIMGGRGGQSGHDPHYSEWRRRQIEDLDRDYDEYRREHHSKFEQEFGSWRSKRQGQRQALNKATEHMEVVGSDGSHVGKVDKVRGDRIILAKSDPDAGGIHHSIPCSWVEKVDDKVSLNRTAEEAKEAWRSEERNRALFERGNEQGNEEGGDGPRNLNRSFSGTYRDRDE